MIMPQAIIDQKPKASAFSSQSQISMDSWQKNLIKPIAQAQSGFHSSSFTQPHFNEDKFSERLNAMLQFDMPNTNLLKSTSIAQLQNLNNNKQYTLNSNRPLSATFNSSLDFNNLGNNPQSSNIPNRPTSTLSYNQSKQSNLEFNSQLDELQTKNLQVQQRLRQLQQEQKVAALGLKPPLSSNSSEQSNIEYPMSNNSSNNSDTEQKSKNDALDKLKQEQLLLKEQINLLNKQRESAQQELEILSTGATKTDKNFIQTSFLKHFNQINSNFETGTHTPGLSPIPPENMITEVNFDF